MSLNSPERQRAVFHEVRARNYRRQAELLLPGADQDSAGVLLYESAKQCINAVANQYGNNPRPTVLKLQFLRSLAEMTLAPRDLMLNWRAADRLHVNADQGQLDTPKFVEAWESAQACIDEMLLIYARSE